MRRFVSIHTLWLALTATAVVTTTSHAHATIVYGGKQVPAWPDLDQQLAPPPSPPVAFDVVGAPHIHLFPHPSGVVRGLTILVDFSDQTGAYSKQEVDAWLNTKGYTHFGLTGSIRDYYLKQSNGMVDYQNEVHGFYRAKKPKSYYQGGTSYERADELWAEVSAALDAEIDYSQFDNDGDGKTEAISLLYAGDEGTFGKGLWPHAGASNDMRDGVRLNRYMMTAMDDQPTNYVFAHESGHMLFGWPDLYGVGDYSIMANRDANTNPVGIDDVLRADQGWIDIVDIQSTTNARYQAIPNGVAYRYLNPVRPSEYFLWSNVRGEKSDEWLSLAGGGLLVWHFDKSIGANNPPEPLELAVVQGGGTRQLSGTTWPSPGSAKTDFFGKGVNTELAAQTNPTSHWNDGSASGLRIYDIGESAPSMEFSVGTGPISNGGSGGTAGTSSTAGASTGGSNEQAGADLGGSAGESARGGASGNASGGAQAMAGGVAAGGASASGASASGASASGAANTPSGGTSSNSAAPNNEADAGCSCAILPQSRGHRTLGLVVSLLGLVATRRRRPRRSHGAA